MAPLTTRTTNLTPDACTFNLENVPLSWLRTLCPSETIAAAVFVEDFISCYPDLKGTEEETILVFGYMNKTLDLRHIEFYSHIFHNARNKLFLARSPGEIAVCLMAMVCFVRLYPPPISMVPGGESFVNEFDRLLLQECTDTMAATLEHMLTSLHRVLVAEDFSYRDPNLADQIARFGVRQSLLRLSDTHSDLYWGDRLTEPISHGLAFENVCFVVGYPQRALSGPWSTSPSAQHEPQAHSPKDDPQTED